MSENQALDIWLLLQVSQVYPKVYTLEIYVGFVATNKPEVHILFAMDRIFRDSCISQIATPIYLKTPKRSLHFLDKNLPHFSQKHQSPYICIFLLVQSYHLLLKEDPYQNKTGLIYF